MHESFLYYIWQFQFFDKKELTTYDGEKIEVFNPGTLNTQAGPDFHNARVKIDGIAWVGNVEIHTKSSDWLTHKHNHDQAYENVVLHVVWQNDKPVYRSDKTSLPTLELHKRVDESLVNEYKKLVHTPFSIPCQKSFPNVDPLIKLSMVDRAVIERLEKKAAEIAEMLRHNRNDWEETTFQLLARNFGFNVNSEAFLQLGKSLPYKILLKHADQLVQLEALLFGQAGFLDVPVGDTYYKILRREYSVLCQKYSLSATRLTRARWKFLRLRPANFPTLRIAQFSALIHYQKNIFSKILDAKNDKVLFDLFSVQQSEYWQQHYQFNRKARHGVLELGRSGVDNILINTVAPLLVAYGKFNDQQAVIDHAVQLLQCIPAENNTIIKTWKQAGYIAKTSFDSQALIELYKHYCRPRNCLTCTIGASLVKPKF